MDEIKTTSAARKVARKLHAQGMKSEDIGAELAKRGYVSRRGKGPLKSAGVYYLLQPRSRKTGKRRAPEAVAASTRVRVKTGGGTPVLRLRLVRSICEQADMTAEDRIAAIMLMLN